MKAFMFFVLLLGALTAHTQNSIYSFKVNAANGEEIDFNDFRGKLIMVVNIASGSERNKQSQQLDTLCRLYASQGLVVVAVPSNDFNKEPKTNEQIQTWAAGLHPNLRVTAKATVSGASPSPLYEWCTKKTGNGVMDTPVTGDYQKFIISKEGKLIGAFNGVVGPLSEPVFRAINANINN
jgi:glutathione peroxidase